MYLKARLILVICPFLTMINVYFQANNTSMPLASSGVTISGNNMNSATVNLQQQSYNHQKNIGNPSDPYFQQMIGNHAQENKRNNARLSNAQYDNITVNESTAPPPIPPPPIITPSNAGQGPSWC